MTNAFDYNEFPAYCCICLKPIKNDREMVSIDKPVLSTNLSLRDLLKETMLEPSAKSESEISGYTCQSCCCKLEDVYLFRSQCTEMYKFYTTLQFVKECGHQQALVELVENATSGKLLSHLCRLGVISKVDVSTDEFLKEIGFNNRETVPKTEECITFEIELMKQEESDSYVSDRPNGNASSSESSDDEPLAEISRKSILRRKFVNKTSERTTCAIKTTIEFLTCPVSDCQELLGNQKYADHLKEFHRYGCKQCGLVLTSKYTMGKHITLHTNRPLTIKCTFCERMFPHMHKMRAHAKDVHLQRPNNYECDECEAKFESRKLLNEHRESHLPKKCTECEIVCDHSSKMLYHIKKYHPEKLLDCQHCPRKFLKQKLLERHLLEHSENTLNNSEEAYDLLTIKTTSISVCSQCEKQFTSEAYRLAHMSSHDPASRPKVVVRKRSKEELEKLELKYHCDQCDASYRLPTSLDSHMKTHSNTQFVCDICGASFKNRTYLKQHVTYKHSRDFRYFCDFCPKACATSSDLQRHRRVHTNERPYRCDQCEARFKTNDGYRKHMRSHTGEKIYQCDLCDRSFKCHSSLKTHKISHTNEKAYKCFYCEQHFNVPKNRRRHILRLHPGLPTNKAAE